jgi:hypothetical protein
VVRSFLGVTTAAALLIGGPVFAHHSLAQFDREKTIAISGTVKEFVWANPHVLIEVVAEDAKRENIVWSIEGSAATVLARDGWRPTMLKPGDKISLSIHPRKDGSTGGYYADERPLVINNELQ